MCYAATATSGIPLAGIYNVQSTKSPIAQIQREVVLNIMDPLTIQSLRAMSPGNLKVHVERATQQSNDEDIASVRILSSSQLKSGNLSIEKASSSEIEALRKSVDSWAHHIGSGTSVQIPTYGVLVYSIRTSTVGMGKFKEDRKQILHDNRTFIPWAKIRHGG